jgi:hypothetical protein
MISKYIRIIPIILILLISNFSAFSYIQTSKAFSSNGQTTLYFKDVLNVDPESDYDSNLGLTLLLSESFPSKINDSYYPPKIFNGRTSNTEELSVWISTWLFYFLDDFSEEFGEIDGLLEGFELFFPNPLKIVESYEYTGEEDLEIEGDINFNLYLSSNIFSKVSSNDKVNVGVYSLNPNAALPIPIKISNKTIDVNPELIQNIDIYNIVIEDVNHTLDPGETLIFEIELIPGNKTIINILTKERPILKNLANFTIDFLYNIANNSGNTTLNDIIDFIDMFDDIVAESNLTIDDASIILNSLISTSLVYDSISHPSSVSLPFIDSPEDNGENHITYFLHSNNSMDINSPDSVDHTNNDLTNVIQWSGPLLDRSKILLEASSIIYIKYKDINFFSENIKINGKLIYDDTEIGSSNFILEKTQILSPTKIITVNLIFDDINNNIEIEHNKYLSLEISLDNSSDLGNGILREAEILYDSVEYSSRILVKFTETDNINLNFLSDPADYKIIPGDFVKYTLNVFSKYDDEIEIIELSYSGNKNYWDIIIPEKFTIFAGENKSLELIIISTQIDLSIYGENIEIEFAVQGKTGKSVFTTYAIISEDAVNYDINLIIPEDKEIKHGTSESYYFIVENNNSGLWPDSYSIEAISENGWNLTIDPKNIDNLAAGERVEINITLFIPINTEISNDTLNFTVKSINSDVYESAEITTDIIGPNLLENIYNYFETLSYDLGLDDIFNEYAPHVLVTILALIIFIIIILIAFILTTKFVNIICNDRVKEINPSQIGEFKIKLVNPTKKIRNYEINIIDKNNSSKWIISKDIDKILLNPKESKIISFSVKPTDLVQKNDWSEFDFIVKTIGKNKIQKITTMIVLKNFLPDIKINGSNHFPINFKNGDKIITSFILNNYGNASSDPLYTILKVNGEEKNKVGDIIIPAKGFAEIKIPWIAVKGKNEISIVVRKY